jgi:hypothetical protein
MSLRREIGRYHAVIFTLVRNPGAPDRRMHVLYLLQSPVSPRPVVTLIEYFIDIGRARFLSWQRETARAVGLLIDFLTANSARLRGEDNPKVFAKFAEALVAGTLDLNGNDPSELFWESKTVSRARNLLRAVTAFSDWLENRHGTRRINPWRDASIGEQIAFWRRLDKRNANSLLGYASYRSDNQARAKISRVVTIQRKVTTAFVREVKFFPSDRIWDLLFRGFGVRRKQHSPLHEQLSVKDILVTILLHGGGLQESEPFHLYVPDVGIDPQNPKSAVVRLYHPEQGAAPADYIDPLTGAHIQGDREEYLRMRWQMQPRNLIEGRSKAGWKDLHLFDQSEKYALVHWFPSLWGELFLTFFKLYITHCRSRCSPHPFLFVSQKAGFEGEPYTVDSYRQAHARAVRRIGLVPARSTGTTPHGHRHAYGQRLADAEVGELIIQRVMHHKSPASQRVYTEAPAAKIEEALATAQQRLAGIAHEPIAFLESDIRVRQLLGWR